MPTVSAYRVEVLSAPREAELGMRLLLEWPDLPAPRYTLQVELVELVLAEGVRVGRTAKGEPRLYHDFNPYGQTAEAALALGWCRIRKADDDSGTD